MSCHCVHASATRRMSERKGPLRSRKSPRAVDCRADLAVNKRNLLLGFAAFVAIESPEAAQAWDGPAKFLKSRQQANLGKLTAPLDVSMKRLEEAQRLVGQSKYSAALQLIRTASCNCYKFENFSTDSFDSKMSIMTQNIGVADPCTFRIIVKNVTVLMDDTDALKMETKEVLAQVVGAYEFLDDLILSADEFAAEEETKGQVGPAIARTIELEQKLKEQIKLCIAQEA